MKKEYVTASPQLSTASLAKRMMIGAAIAFIVILFFILPVKTPHPSWPKLWMIRPLIIVPLAGAAGGVVHYWMDRFRRQGYARKIGADLLSILIYLVVLWIGIILGLAGTLWN